jgi:hypothetical protein
LSPSEIYLPSDVHQDGGPKYVAAVYEQPGALALLMREAEFGWLQAYGTCRAESRQRDEKSV